MPVVLKYCQEDGTIVLWKIEEEEGYFMSKIDFSTFDTDELQAISHPAKRLEWLASRYLIRFIMDKPGIIHLNKKANGKPIIENYDEFVSITHTQGYAAVIHSRNHVVSIDAEFMEDRVRRIRHKFLSARELEDIGETEGVDPLIAYWSIKETIFKLLEIPGLNFSKEIQIEKFDCFSDQYTQVQVANKACHQKFTVYFKRIGNIYLTWCGETPKFTD